MTGFKLGGGFYSLVRQAWRSHHVLVLQGHSTPGIGKCVVQVCTHLCLQHVLGYNEVRFAGSLGEEEEDDEGTLEEEDRLAEQEGGTSRVMLQLTNLRLNICSMIKLKKPKMIDKHEYQICDKSLM